MAKTDANRNCLGFLTGIRRNYRVIVVGMPVPAAARQKPVWVFRGLTEVSSRAIRRLPEILMPDGAGLASAFKERRQAHRRAM